MNRFLSLALLLLSSVLLVNSCGDDQIAGVEGSGSPVAAGSPIVSNGRISGLGSIFVEGTEYSLDHATIMVDGQSGTSADLAVGDVVTVTGTTVTSLTHADALSVVSDTDIAGPIGSVSADRSRITVLNQDVAIDVLTNTLVNFYSGQSVRISGFLNSQGVWTARRVSLVPANMPLIVSGYVAGLTTSQSFNIGALTVSAVDAAVSGVQSGIANGMFVRVTGRTLDASGTLLANSIVYANPALPGKEGDSALVEGWVTRVASDHDFDVNRHHVKTAPSVTVENAPNGLTLDSFVRVMGTRDVSGGVYADWVVTCNAPVAGLPRSGHTATLLANGKVLLIGGDPCSELADLFDPGTDSYSTAGFITTQRYQATATELKDGRVLIAGGWAFKPGSNMGQQLQSAELYDPATGQFALTGSMTLARSGHTATLLADGRVLITGGLRSFRGGGAATDGAEIYDPPTAMFAAVSNMNSARVNHTATLLPNGSVLIEGGWNGHAADSLDDPPWDPLFVEIFNPQTLTFSPSANMSTTRAAPHTATQLTDGRVLLLGGIYSLQNIHEQPPHPAYSEVFDPIDSAIHALSTPALSRSGYTATLLPSGKVLLLGGADQQDRAVATAELVDPATGIVTRTTNLATARYGHTATLLPDERVLVIGGTDENGNTLAGFEYWSGAP